MNSYELSRIFWDYSFENPQKIKPYHASIYFFAIEHCNRLGWKKIFGFPTSMVIEAIGMKSYNSYKKYFDELVDFGFFKVHEYSKNQYSSNVIELSFKVKALNKALDKALIKHRTKQSESTEQSIDSIIKQINNKQYNNKQLTKLKDVIGKVLNEDLEIRLVEVEENKRELFNNWISYKKEIKKPLKSDRSITALINKFNENSYDCCKWVVNNSIENQYQGLFWQNYKPQQSNNNNLPNGRRIAI